MYLPPPRRIIMGFEPGQQVANLTASFTTLARYALEWKHPLVIASIDVKIAFDEIKPEATSRNLLKKGAPVWLTAA